MYLNSDFFLNLFTTIGGLGLFLLGMVVMTDGLRNIAGQSIQTCLMHFIHSPVSGATTGAISTAILQSSSATTVAAVGFVSAGLMDFSASLGIIFGANIGTTITGWLVALVGFKLKLGLLVMPLIFVGVLLHLFTKKQIISNSGLALAGFGLIFVGIATLQDGMQDLQTVITFEHFPADTFLGRLMLVAIGMIFTIITQSSSAGVAAALTALNADMIHFNQAAALVVGMDIGTTVTAVIATIGGSTSAKRTGFSHVIYNCFTGVGAFLFIPLYSPIVDYVFPGQLNENPEIALVAFHTLFNFLGVIIVLPFTRQFANMMKKLVDNHLLSPKGSLDDILLGTPSLALIAIQVTTQKQFLILLEHINAILTKQDTGKLADLTDLQLSLDETHKYIDKIHLNTADLLNWQRLLSEIHVLDHLQRLHERCEEDLNRANTAISDATLSKYCNHLANTIDRIISSLQSANWMTASKASEQLSITIIEESENLRATVMNKVATGELGIPEATLKLEGIRWLKRVSRHIARIIHHYYKANVVAKLDSEINLQKES